MRTLFAAAIALFTLASLGEAAPISDGSIYVETFTNYPESPLSQVINTGSTVSSGAAHISTTTGTEGVVRVRPLVLPAEYVTEFDWKLNGPSGDNFYLVFNQGDAHPWDSSIAVRAIESGANWKFQVDFAGGGWDISDELNYGQFYHITVHNKPGVNRPVDLYVDGVLMGTYDSRNPSISTTLFQLGDSSGGSGYGDATIDNISIGLPVIVPEPSSIWIVVTMFGMTAAIRRRAC